MSDVVQRLRTRAEAKRRHRAEGNQPTPTLYGSPRLDDEAADEIEKWRALAMDWMKIAAVLICPDDDDTERLAWASGEGWDALQERTTEALGLYHGPSPSPR